jgi:vacuolar-type H+-ATPase subunit D/Vma8
MYILPVVFVSVVLNVPKFFEITVKMELDNTTGVEVPTITNTNLRHNKHYIFGYVMWTRDRFCKTLFRPKSLGHILS